MMQEAAWPPPRESRPSRQSSRSSPHRKQSWDHWVRRSQRRISSGHKQSAAKSLLPGIRHQPPPLQKGPSRGRRCCCSTTSRGPRSQFLPCERLGNAAECCQPEERVLSRWHSLAGFGSWSLPTNTSWGIPDVPCPGAGLAALGKSWYWGENQSIKRLRDVYSSAISNVPTMATGYSSPSLPALPVPAGGCTVAPVQVSTPGTRVLGDSSWSPPPLPGATRHGVKLPRERREEDSKNNQKNLFHAAWILPRTQQCFWTANL